RITRKWSGHYSADGATTLPGHPPVSSAPRRCHHPPSLRRYNEKNYMTEPSWYSILPPVLAIVLAIWSKQVLLSLFAGIWIGYTLLNGYNPLAGVTEGIEGMVNVFGDAGDTRVLIFTLIIGSLIATIEHSGGVRGFVHFLESRRWVHNARRAQVLAWATGLVIF